MAHTFKRTSEFDLDWVPVGSCCGKRSAKRNLHRIERRSERRMIAAQIADLG